MLNIKGLSDFITITLFTTFIAAIIINYIKWILKWRHFCALAAKVPSLEGIRMLPIIGHGAVMNGNLEELLAKTRILCAEIKPPRKVWIWHELMFVINRAEDMEIILNSRKCLSKHDVYRFNEPFVKGLVVSPVPVWRNHRKIIMPTFNQKNLEGFVEIFSEQAEIFVDVLKSKTGEIVDVGDYTSKFALDIICETTMGIQIKAQLNDIGFGRLLKRSMEIITTRLINPLYHIDWIYKFSKLFREEQKCVKKFKSIILNVVEKKLAYYENTAGKNNKLNKENIKKSSFLELLIDLTQNGENWTSEDLFDEVSTFMVAGSDTTSAVLASVMVLLGMHEEIQERCFDEIKETVGLDSKIVYTDLPKFVYLEQVIKETMRLFPPGSLLFRRVDEDMEVGGYVLPKGAGITLHVLTMHYSEVYYKNPWTFDPDHFSPEEVAKRHKYAFLPFSGGARNCIGYKFAMLAMKMLMVNVIRSFRMKTTAYTSIRDIRVRQEVVLKFVEGYPLRLIPRS